MKSPKMLAMVNFIALMAQFIQNLLRKTSGRPVIKEIDGLRAVAIIAVLLSHFNLHLTKAMGLDETFLYSQPVSRFLELCGNGVSIFFCISAFILSMPFIEHYLYNKTLVQLKQYYLRRLTRLEVPYLLVLTVLFLFQLLMMNESFREILPHYISSFFYSHNIAYGRRSTINPVAWTLEIEIQFYLLLPLLVKLFLIKHAIGRRLLLIALIVCCGFCYARFDGFFINAHLQYSIFAYLPVFLMGFLLADLYLQYKQLLIQQSILWDAVFIAGFVLVVYCNGDTRFYMQWLEYISYPMLFIGMFKGTITNKVFTTNWLMLIGTMCYSIYLLHYAILYFLVDNISSKWLSNSYYQDLLLQGIIVLPTVILASVAFYWLVEKPCMDRQWPRKLLNRIKGIKHQ
jgi:peptidoglycan/LPS O-acetylase OafA/YrhL